MHTAEQLQATLQLILGHAKQFPEQLPLLATAPITQNEKHGFWEG